MERIGALVGPEGKTKSAIEREFSTNLQIDSETGGITITLEKEATDPSTLFRAKEIVTAIGRGFSPEHAFRLVRDEESALDILDLRDTFGKSESDIKRIKGRIIGMKGKTRRIIEEMTDTNIAVFGHTVSIIGNASQIDVAREAIQMFINGSEHSTVYRVLQKKRHDLKKKSLEIWKEPSSGLP